MAKLQLMLILYKYSDIVNEFADVLKFQILSDQQSKNINNLIWYDIRQRKTENTVLTLQVMFSNFAWKWLHE